MKNILLYILILITACVFGQDTIPTPDFASRPYYLISENKLENLERAEASIDTKIRGAGYGGYDMYYTAFSATSTIRFKQTTLPRIFIKVDGNSDPSEMVTLSKGEIKKDRRRFLQGSAKLGGKARDVSGSEVKIEFKKIRDGLFEILLPPSMTTGEYAFMPVGDSTATLLSGGKPRITCFGID
jgi:hypothetical protein